MAELVEVAGLLSRHCTDQARQCMAIIPEPGRRKYEDLEFKATLGYVRSHHKDKLISIKSEAEMQRQADLWEFQSARDI